MPWKMSDAKLNTKKADTPAKKEKFAKVANAVLKKTGDDVKALKIAKSVIKKDNRGEKEKMTKAATKPKKY